MQIGELAKRSGVTVQAVRFYERLKLLPEPQRKDSGYRVYSETDLKRLRFVRGQVARVLAPDFFHCFTARLRPSRNFDSWVICCSRCLGFHRGTRRFRL